MSTVSMEELMRVAELIGDAINDSPTCQRADLEADSAIANSDHPADGVIIEITHDGSTFQVLVTKS